MSVINKVLRDLDQRAAAAGGPLGDPAAGAALTRGTAIVEPPAKSPRTATRRAAGLLLPGVAATALGLWLWWWAGAGGTAAPRDQRAAASLPLAPVASTPAAVVTAGAHEPGPAVVPHGAASGLVGAQPEGTAGRATPPATPVVGTIPVLVPPLPSPASKAASLAVQPTPVGLVAQAPSVMGRALPAPASGDPAVADAARPKLPAPPRPEPALVSDGAPVLWPEAAMEAIGQAQKLWNAGARDAAVGLLRDALAGIERAHGAELVPTGAGAPVGLVMVRELVRMEMLQAQHGAALALLKRHERLLAGHADLWAVRGNAAQRLSQHAESAQSYLMALKIRPAEPRWLLGAAVALAAQGQLAQAGDLVQQARAFGVVSPDVLAYLRQLGVAVRE